MPTQSLTRSLLSATLGLTLLAGCSMSLPTMGGSLSGATAGLLAGTPFASASALAKVSSTTEARTALQARAIAASDASLVEGASALLEQAEAKASYRLAALDPNQQSQKDFERGAFGGGLFEAAPGKRQAPRPRIERQAPPPAPGFEASFETEDRIAFGDEGGRERAGGRRLPPPPPREGGERFEVGGGLSARGEAAGGVRVERGRQRSTEERREADCATRERFLKQQPAYNQDEAMIAQVLASQGWQPNAALTGTLKKSGTATLTLGNGVSRKIAVLRVVDEAKPHALALSQIDIEDVLEDGASKTVHWEKSRQADGSYVMVYHHEIVNAEGQKFVADWTKTEGADGTITGTGTFVETDKDGNPVAKQVLTIGGDAESGQTITTDEVAAAPEETADDATTDEEEEASEA